MTGAISAVLSLAAMGGVVGIGAKLILSSRRVTAVELLCAFAFGAVANLIAGLVIVAALVSGG